MTEQRLAQLIDVLDDLRCFPGVTALAFAARGLAQPRYEEVEVQHNRIETWILRDGWTPELYTVESVEGDMQLKKFYTCNEKQHRDGDRPAGLRVSSDLIGEAWYSYGLLSRKGDLPSTVFRYANRIVSLWTINEQLGREADKPSRIVTTLEGRVVKQEHRRGMHHHRDPKLGPAKTEHKASGDLWEEYRVDGQLHREDGPARVVSRVVDGQRVVRRQDYFINGVRVESS